MSATRDPYLALPLDGVRVIEASAGTGKTFTLATLVIRLVVERGLKISEILAVTFTEAATQELRSRIRARLMLAAKLVGKPPAADASPEAMLTHDVLDAHLAQSTETEETLRARLYAAANDIDLAAIFTIHSFCARVLSEHALESGQGLDAPELMTSDAVLRKSVAADLWRAYGATDDMVDNLFALWIGGPQELAKDLTPLVRERVLRPELAELPDDPAPRLRAAGEVLANTLRTHGDDFHAALIGAVENKILNGKSYTLTWIDDLFASLKAWCALGDTGVAFEHAKLGNLQRKVLAEKTNKTAKGPTPDSPICDAIPAYLDALAAIGEWNDVRRAELLHRISKEGRERFTRFKQQQRVQTYDDLIDRVADVFDIDPGVGADAAVKARRAEELVVALRRKYRIALVDEFQDTDARQWRIFERVFGAASGDPALFVIGDPKQAIYGFRGGDVETYLSAKEKAEEAPALTSNFRSRPSLLRAVAALYARAQSSGHTPFVDGRISFFEVSPGGLRQDTDYLRHGSAAPALTLWQVPPTGETYSNGKPKSYSASQSRELATRACVAEIHRVLTDARAGYATVEGRPVEPGDIAVLVRSHSEATRIRQALTHVGIPAVAAGKQSLFATDEARDVYALLLALLHGADDGRLRTALSTVLIGQDAMQIAALDVDGGALRSWQLAAVEWRIRLQRGGPLALVSDLCAEQANRLLGLLDGERRLTNYLQLAELLQEAQSRVLGLHGLVDWLSRAIASASDEDDSQLLRLESDARRVQVVTLHKSKGLEYPLVFLPFAGIVGKASTPGHRVIVAGEEGRVLHWKLLPSVSGWEDAKNSWTRAQHAEDARLLYVGLTRARHALWLAGGPFCGHEKAAIANMIVDPVALAAALGSALRVDTDMPPAVLPWLPLESDTIVPPARIATRRIAPDWWVYSFTQLAHAEGGADPLAAATQADPGGEDEAPTSDADTAPVDTTAPVAADPRFAGSRFGVVMHAALENADFAAWRDWQPGAPAPAQQADVIVAALREGGYADADLDDGLAVLVPLVGQTLCTALPEGVRLADLPPDARRAEIEFHFAMQPTGVPALLALLHHHGLLRARTAFGTRPRLEGLMTGLIDLTYCSDGRWYVLDYKSNQLPAYDAAAMQQAMAHSEYDLQALIYTLALHRWLRFRLGDAYDYARDFGGIRYLFCRGLDMARQPSPGVHAQRFAPELVHALDALFAGGSEGTQSGARP
jgi:exodeoxyribonuclease V beta subunit